VREGIEKLREYRAALISAAATGKIDVRGSSSGRAVGSPLQRRPTCHTIYKNIIAAPSD
jgi:hypothetical protein